MAVGTFTAIPVYADTDVSVDGDAVTGVIDGETAEDESTTDTGGSGFRSSVDVKRFLGTVSYKEYSEKYQDTPAASESIFINAVDYDPELTTAKVEVKNDYEGMEGESLLMPSEGKTTWKFTVPKTGRYAIRITYYPEPGTFTTIERMIYIDDLLPFTESRYYYFPRSWEYQLDADGEFDKDINGNDIRPIREEAPEWQTYFLRDWLGFTMDPFEYYLTEGEHTITFEATREPMVLSTIELYGYEDPISYEEYISNLKAQGVTEIKTLDEPIKFQAEKPYAVSNASTYPTNDRTSALTEPQDPAVMKYNLVNDGTINQWIKYKVTVPEAGLYNIVVRFRQNTYIGMFSTRRLYVNGEIPFEEANRLRFHFSPDWQVTPLHDGNQNFLIYLEKGENELMLEPVLGDMEEYVYRVEQMLDDLNGAYQQIIQLTGPSPDTYRDYGFGRLVPEALVTIGNCADDLYEIYEELKVVTGDEGDLVKTLDTAAKLFEKIARDEYEIAPNLITYKNYIIMLSNWLYSTLNQPIKIDYYVVQGTEDELPTAVASFLDAAWFEVRAFVMSFFMDYTTIGYKDDVEYDPNMTVESWITDAVTGRDNALIQRYLIDNYFTPESGISVTIKVITAGIQEAILAGIGPDVANMDTTNTITWGLRNAVESLNDKEGFNEVTTWFPEAALVPLTMYDKTYGLPETMTYALMFYRSDIFADLNLDVPETWEELYEIIPTLQNSNYQIAIPIGLDGYKMFLYQNGSELYRDNGLRINVDSNEALDAFEDFTDMFTKYKSPIVTDITRFRTGENPIMVQNDGITAYNTLMGFYELRGLWEMAPLLGVRQEDGSINHTSPVTVNALVIPRGATNPDATWEYLKWRTCEDTQIRQNKENLAINANPTAKLATSNKAALLKLAWTDYEYAAIKAQVEQLVGIPDYPGCYIVTQYVNSAFQVVYGDSSDAATEMLNRVLYINKELSRKRREFHMDYYDLDSTRDGTWQLIESDRGLNYINYGK